MKTVTLKQAKARLAALVDLAERGEVVVITKGGKPVARLEPIRRARTGGFMTGFIAEDFDAPLPGF